jgi:hypothetical protein
VHTFLLFWSWPDGTAWSNVLAMPACGLVGLVAAFVFRDRLGRLLKGWFRRHLGHGDELAEIRELAARAHRIAADTHRHLTGEHHPDAPERGGHGTDI